MDNWSRFGRALAGSFIERRFLLAFALVADGIEPVEIGTAFARVPDGLLLHRELPVRGWRLDFAITHERLPMVRVDVEVDGRSFHSGWREAERDRRRDRDLLEHGWSVVRFSGSEMTRTPMTCALAAGRIVRRMSAVASPQFASAAPREQLRLRFNAVGA